MKFAVVALTFLWFMILATSYRICRRRPRSVWQSLPVVVAAVMLLLHVVYYSMPNGEIPNALYWPTLLSWMASTFYANHRYYRVDARQHRNDETIAAMRKEFQERVSKWPCPFCTTPDLRVEEEWARKSVSISLVCAECHTLLVSSTQNLKTGKTTHRLGVSQGEQPPPNV